MSRLHLREGKSDLIRIASAHRFEYQEICAAIEFEKKATAGVSYMSFFKSRGNRHRLLVIVVSVRHDQRETRWAILTMSCVLLASARRFLQSMGW